jgi:hypothetical protein
MNILLLALLCLTAHAYDVGDWPQEQLRASAVQVLSPESTVVQAEGIPLRHAGATRGVILARHQQGAYTYTQVITVFERGGQTWLSSGWGAGGGEDVGVLGVLDLDAPGTLELHDGWVGSEPQEPVLAPNKPVLAVLSRVRFDDGVERVELLLLDLTDPEKPWQLLRAQVGTRLPIWDPRSDMPVQRSLGSQALSLAMVQGEQGPELQLVQRDLPTPDSRCLEPRPETRRFLFQEGRFVEQYSQVLHEPCP